MSLTTKNAIIELSINIFLYLIDIHTFIVSKFKRIYDTNPYFKNCVDLLNYTRKSGIATLHGEAIEPYQQEWVSIDILVGEDPRTYKCIKYYSDTSNMLKYWFKNNSMDGTDFQKVILQERFYSLCDCAKVMFESIQGLHEIMVTLKIQGNYTSFVFFRNLYNYRWKYQLSMLKSSVRFLSIEYTHPEMLYNINIDISNDMFIENTTLLSPLFVKKYLDGQYQHFVFDMNYKINIIDMNIESLSIHSDEYIHIYNKTYSVVKMRLD